MCLWNTDAPGSNKFKIWQKSFKSYILTPPNPQGQLMSVKCEEPIIELTVQIWLLYHHPNFKYCTFFVSRTELRTDRQTNGQMDRQKDHPITRCPQQTFQAWGIKTQVEVWIPWPLGSVNQSMLIAIFFWHPLVIWTCASDVEKCPTEGFDWQNFIQTDKKLIFLLHILLFGLTSF